MEYFIVLIEIYLCVSELDLETLWHLRQNYVKAFNNYFQLFPVFVTKSSILDAA